MRNYGYIFLFSFLILVNTIYSANAQNNEQYFNDSLVNAIVSSNPEKVKEFIQKGADVNYVNYDGTSVLILSIIGGNLDIVEYLINAGADYNKEFFYITALFNDEGYIISEIMTSSLIVLAVNSGNVEILKFLHRKCRFSISNPDTINDNGNIKIIPVLHHAIRSGNIDIIRYCLNNRANVNTTDESGNTALHIASEKGSTDILDLILEKNPEIDILNNGMESPILTAVKNKNYRIARLLLDRGADINITDYAGNNALFYSVRGNDTLFVRSIIDKTPMKNLTDSFCNSLLIESIINGNNNNEMIRFLLTEFKNKTTHVTEWIYYALENNRFDIAKDIITLFNFDVNQQLIGDLTINNPYAGATILHEVIRKMVFNWGDDVYSPFIDFLIERGADINLKDNSGKTALFFAAEDSLTTEYLILKDANVNDADKYGHTPLWNAISNNNFSVAKQLVDHGAIFPDNQSDLFINPTINQNLEMVKFMVEHGVSLQFKKNHQIEDLRYYGNLLSLAIDNVNQYDPIGSLDMIRYYMEICGLKVNAKEQFIYGNDTIIRTAFFLAVTGGDTTIVKYLLDRGALINDRDHEGNTPLMYTTDLNMIKLLVNRGADIRHKNKKGKTLIHDAASLNNTSVINFCIQKGCNVNETDNFGKTPLHYAAGNKSMNSIKLLFFAGAKPDVRDSEGKFALDYAIKNKDTSAIDFLKNPCMDVISIYESGYYDLMLTLKLSKEIFNQKDSSGKIILHKIIDDGRIEFLEKFSLKYQQINYCDNNGRTPLNYAIFTGNIEAAKILIKSGADINKPDNHGETPLLLAKRRNFIELTTLLKSKGASEINSINEKPGLVLPIGHISGINDIDFSSDDKYMLTSSGNIVKLWDLMQGREIKSYNIIPSSDNICFSPEGSMFITSDNYRVSFWDIHTGEFIKKVMINNVQDWDYGIIQNKSVLKVEKEGGYYLYRPLVSYNDSVKVMLFDMHTGKKLLNLP
ncbi:MAG: ankyrin repeat domain-containing protein, partial [Bacteroidota bacterium]